MEILKNVVAVIGEYQKGGETKKIYRTIGQLCEGQYGQFIMLNADTNLAAFPRKAGSDKVMCNLYEPRDRANMGSGSAKPSESDSSLPSDFDEKDPF